MEEAKSEADKVVDPKTCKHEPDPTTLKFDKKAGGRRAICKLCGKPISVRKLYRLPGDPPRKSMKITSSDRREAKRRNYKLKEG